ncbi:unnamed protein product [Meloidogyne enterolobii]|uniref:Uncharacterized protein n=1 Tax=Meloidogyne enterolobii TaxID=390850 RepID=A0ACB0Z0P8_MELEN
MSYGQKPAWARSQGSQQQLNPNLFTGQLGLATTGQSFGGIPGMPLAGLVNQAAFSSTMGMNMLAQAQRSQMLQPQQQQIQQVQSRQQQSSQQQPSSSPARSQRTFIGVITKMMETYGFVDEDVFFQTSVIRGTMPRLGDRVMVEANYNPSMPFKWNAYQVRLINDTSQGGGGLQQQQASRQLPPPQQQNGMSSSNRWAGSGGGGGGSSDRRSNIRDEPRRQVPSTIPRRSSPVAKRPSSRQRTPPRRTTPRKREASPRREAFGRKEREHDRGDSSSVRGQSTKLDADSSPPRRRQRIIPRYHCNMPKQTLPLGDMKNADLRRRYASLYIPSDFIRCSFDWISSIPLETPIKFSPHPINFHVLHKDIDAPLALGEEAPIENPVDADYRYIVKVMLISHPGLMTIRRKLSGLMSDGSIDEATETQPLTKTIQLLVGHRGKGEYMCIGGPWSPSLDGQNPLDPVTLVKTAIRTTRAMTGLNLSDCSKWYKIAHLRYLRAERQRIDSVVLMLPDTSAIESFKVDEESYKICEQLLRDQLAVKLAAIDAEQFNEKKETEGENVVDGEKSVVEKGVDGGGIEKATTTTTATAATSAATSSTSTLVATSAPEVGVEPPSKENNAVPDLCIATEEVLCYFGKKYDGGVGAMDSSSPQKSADTSQETLQSPKKETKTHWSLLEPVVRTMKVAELREELELRGLDSKGLKNVLSQRLSEAIGKEKENDEKNENQVGQQQPQEKPADEAMPDTEQQQQNLVSKEQQQEVAKPNEQQPPAQKTTSEPSIMVKIKEEIIELMETDEAEVNQNGILIKQYSLFSIYDNCEFLNKICRFWRNLDIWKKSNLTRGVTANLYIFWYHLIEDPRPPISNSVLKLYFKFNHFSSFFKPEEKKESPEEQAKREKLEKERQELEKAKEKFEKEKKERKATLERHYSQIPKEPGIFVYPSKTAKGGKFECKLMSIHSLLDYRQDDIKESSFEVFIFVEALREAIDRSNAFVVYHSVATCLDREAEKKRRNETLSEACKDEDVVVINESSGGGSGGGGGKEKEEEKEKEGNKEGSGGQNSDKQPPKSPLSSSTDLRTNFKAIVHNLDLFSAFVHFDGNICGYLTDRDLEEIINSTGLDLSRGEVKNLVKKLVSKERVNYRDLTDKWVDKEGNVKYIPEPIYQGGGSLFESYKELANGHANLELLSVSSNNNLQTPNEASSDIFFYEGKIVNIKQCIQQQQAMEEERQAVLDKNNELDLQLKTTKEQRDILEKKKRRLEDDVDRYRKKLHDAEKNLKKEKDDNEVCKRSLTDCKRYGQRIISIVESVFPPPPPPKVATKEGENIKNNNGENGGGKEAGKEGGKEAKENKESKETSASDVVVLLDECKDDTTTNNSFKEGNNKAQKDDGDLITEPISVEMVVAEGEGGEVTKQQVTKQGVDDVEQNLENKNEGGEEGK